MLMNWITRLSVGLVSVTAMAATDYRPAILGQWQCQSQVSTDYGKTLAIGDVNFANNGKLTGKGDLLLSHPNFATEIPLATQASADWRFEKNTVYLTGIDGSIVSPYPLLNGIATSYKQQVLANPNFAMQLIRIGSKTMVFKAQDGTEIQCLRS